jgi:diaminopimelate decarboxylase
MDDILLQNIAKQYGTPAYVYDAEQLISCIENLRNGIGSKAQLYYSVKANPNEHLIKFINNHVDGMEVCSVGEFKTAQRAGVDVRKTIFVGPGKKEEELRFVISQNIGIIVAESVQELSIINRLAGDHSQSISVALRINPQTSVSGGRLNMSGSPTQFGFDENEALSILNNNHYNNISIDGIHFYYGTQQLDGNVVNQLFIKAIDIFKKAVSISPLRFIDFGGGFGVPYFENENQFDFNMLQEWLYMINSSFFTPYDVFVESGRYLMAACGYFLMKVLYTKNMNGKKFAIADGGMNNHFALASIGRLLKRDFPVNVLNGAQETELISIAGPLCTPVDMVASNTILPVIKPNDILVMKNAGAYGYTYSPQLFLSHPAPVELLFDLDGSIKVIREAKYHE